MKKFSKKSMLSDNEVSTTSVPGNTFIEETKNSSVKNKDLIKTPVADKYLASIGYIERIEVDDYISYKTFVNSKEAYLMFNKKDWGVSAFLVNENGENILGGLNVEDFKGAMLFLTEVGALEFTINKSEVKK